MILKSALDNTDKSEFIPNGLQNLRRKTITFLRREGFPLPQTKAFSAGGGTPPLQVVDDVLPSNSDLSVRFPSGDCVRYNVTPPVLPLSGGPDPIYWYVKNSTTSKRSIGRVGLFNEKMNIFVKIFICS